ncbi:MAG: SH3 domain-containing protein [Chloroflexi bacterium]|nr:SH3 domain-containing protein [Chloroflexota bacterium]
MPRPAPERPAAGAPRRLLMLPLLLAAALGALAVPPLPTAASGPLEAGQRATVSADGDGLNLRAEPAIAADILDRIPDGTLVTALGEQRRADGYDWERVEVGGLSGWMAADYLVAEEQDDGSEPEPEPEPDPPVPVPPEPAPVPTGPLALPVPPAGGLTLGRAGTSDLEELVAAQGFRVAVVWLYRLDSQDYLRYIPGAPAIVNTLDSSSITPESIVLLKRLGDRPQPGAAPEAPDEGVRGTANVLPSPPSEGLTVGVSGTNDPVALAEAQPFEVRLIAFLHVPTQRQLVYIPGAPSFVQSLERGVLEPDSVVWMRAGSVPQAAGTVVEATFSYYYCEQGTIPRGIGDGGGFCGQMANGDIVHPRAAACSRENLGQRFRVIGDPLDRVYTCTDLGSAVRGSHRDIWFENSDDGRLWLDEVGDRGRIEILPEE